MSSEISAPEMPTAIFASEAIEANYLLLEDVFSRVWLDSNDQHPIGQWWRFRADPQPTVFLNWLAEDIKVTSRSRAFDAVLHDLKDGMRFRPTRTTFHAAALLARVNTNSELHFFQAFNDRIPDFEVNISGRSAVLEVKQLTQSDPHADFDRFAAALEVALYAEVLIESRSYPDVKVVLKDATCLPDVELTASLVKEGLNNFADENIEFRSPGLNIFIDCNINSKNFANRKAVYVYCPRSESESDRVLVRARNASKQLRAAGPDFTRILWLGLSEFQDVHFLIDAFKSRFSQGFLSGISNVIFYEPMLAKGNLPIDCATMIKNDCAEIAGFDNLQMGAIMSLEDLREVRPNGQGLSAYTYATTQGVIAGEDAMLMLNTNSILTNEMLA